MNITTAVSFCFLHVEPSFQANYIIEIIMGIYISLFSIICTLTFVECQKEEDDDDEEEEDDDDEEEEEEEDDDDEEEEDDDDDDEEEDDDDEEEEEDDDDEEEDEDEEDEVDEDEEKYKDDMDVVVDDNEKNEIDNKLYIENENSYTNSSLSERLDYIEQSLQTTLNMILQMSRIEYLSQTLLKEEEKYNETINNRLSMIENKYVFHIMHFNNFVNSVYKKVKEESKNKKYSIVMKKIGKMWKDLSVSEKTRYIF